LRIRILFLSLQPVWKIVFLNPKKQVDTLSYKTISANSATVDKQWVIVDAENMVLGRLSSQVAMLIRGKKKPSYTPHVDCGDNVVVINAEKIILSGNKTDVKVYTRYTGYPGGQRFETPRELLKKKPEAIIEKAVKGMLPKNRLGRKLFGNLYVYAGNEHPHVAQQPKPINLNDLR
jgi:large subunit ribosomal protein L13